MSITTTQFLNIADNIAKTLSDIETDFIADPAANAPTVTTITNGQTAVSNSLQARFAALSAGDQAGVAGTALSKTLTDVVTYLTVPTAGIYSLYAPFLLGLDQDLGDLAQFVSTNTLQVHPEFAACFNYIAQNAQRLFGAKYTPTPILPGFVFPSASQTLASIAVTGATTGTFSAGTALDLTKYAPQQLYLKNTAGAPTTGTATSFTVTYTNTAGQTGQTATQALSGALAAGATLAVAGASGSAVSNITVGPGGANGDAIAVVVLPLRTVAY